MQAKLSYPEDANQELYVKEEITTGQTVFTIEAATIAGAPSRPNEDAFAVATNDEEAFIAVFDGVTSLKPIAALNGQTGARFASHFLKKNLAGVEPTLAPSQAILDLNGKLLAESTQLGGALSDTHTLPASIATVVKINADQRAFSFAHIGDSFGIAYYTDGHSEIFTDDKNSKFDAQAFALIAKTAQEQGISPRQAREDERVKKFLLEMFSYRNNNPQGKGSGLVNGDPNLGLYIQTGTVDWEGLSAILLASDGLLPPGWSLENEEDRTRILIAIKEGGFQRLFGLKHQAEDEDPDWNNIRFKHSDDATGILITRGIVKS